VFYFPTQDILNGALLAWALGLLTGLSSGSSHAAAHRGRVAEA